jgi:hypothetical protein
MIKQITNVIKRTIYALDKLKKRESITYATFSNESNNPLRKGDITLPRWIDM